ncbi:hypothetical protein [Cystobacter fuscus]|uniref:hypothetical protein n=1 Tax=Cystobacter fuscus TaxID=43 RepID=UPI0037BE84F5
MLSFVNQQQGELLGRIAGGLKAGRISQEELGPLMESAQKLAHASGEASAKEQFMPDDTKNLSMMLAEHQSTVMKALDKPGVFSFFSAFSSKKPSEAQMTLAQQVGELSQKVQQGSIRDGDLSKLISQQFGSPAGAGHAVSQPSVAGTGGVAGTSAPPAPASTLQQLGGLLQQFSGLVGSLNAPAPQTPTPAHASAPAQQVGNSLAFAPNASTMSNLSQQHGALLAKLDEGVNKGRIALEALGPLRQGLQELGDAIKTTSAKEQITPADLLGLSSLILKNATNLNAAFKQL